ncbi:restriction endonuclease subunit S [Streptococcus equi subsp. zooepidemicus]|nr:restriction endonuclease subunit S [Streptococcus equi subsp. zooepidemicus]MCD3438374.1 restriction endonuclease subunit S [Streptococcus equi subsp. zooepidemicus]
MHGIMPFSFVSPRFLMYAIQSDFIQNQFQNNMSSTTIPILNQTKFSQTIVRFPSIEKQDKVISSIEQLFQKVNQLF